MQAATPYSQPTQSTPPVSDARILDDLSNGAFEQALAACHARLKTSALDATAFHLAAIALRDSGQPQLALKYHARAIELARTRPDHFFHLGQTFLALKLHSEAAAAFALAERFAPKDVNIARAAALCLYETGNPAALPRVEAILETHPTDLASLSLYGTILLALGRPKDASAAYSRAWAIRPNGPTALALAKTAPLDQIKDIHADLSALTTQNCAMQDATYHFALAEIQHRMGDYSAAHDQYVQGNALQNQRSTFDIEAERRLCAEAKSLFSTSVAAPPPSETEGPQPIFIVGLPRSGSTLLSNILSAHSQVTNLGETGELQNAVRRLGALQPDTHTEAFRHLRDGYLGSKPLSDCETPYSLDKNLGNYFYIGHILQAFPDARILHIHRDPRAVCWSIFRQCFSRGQWPCAYDPRNILGFHACFRDLMAFWNRRFPRRILHVSYDSLVAAPDQEIPALIGSLGLHWEEACLTPERRQSMVATASKSQVRRAIYKNSSQDWRCYEPYAGPWLSKLPDTIDWTAEGAA